MWARECTVAPVSVQVLTWNLKHGRAEPPAGRYLLAEFGQALAGWEWDVALLQEVPPWWPAPLAAATGAKASSVLTSRNAGLAVRRALATRWPDLIKSSGGGANAILVRSGEIAGEARRRLCVWPERRQVHGVQLRAGEWPADTWIANLHATAHDAPAAARDNALAAHTVLDWAGQAPAVLGGDFNLRALALAGFEHAGGHDVDHVFVRGLRSAGPVEVLERGALSDHAPVRVTLV
jgi:endonuclease/exonuclease/phosphatase family metal-dependent hydrolase